MFPQDLYLAEFGYWAVSFENFFTNPELIPEIPLGCWLTTFFGALANILFGSLGAIGFKIPAIITLYLILYIVYLLLNPFTTKKVLLFSLLISEMFINISPYTYINYYILTTFFYLLGLLFLYKGLTANKLFFLMIAGLVLGLNIFVRLPNILGISLLFIIIYYELAAEKFTFAQTGKKIIIFLLGYLLAIASILLLMNMIGHYDLYIENIKYLLSNGAGHSSSGIIRMFKDEHYEATKYGLFLFLILFSILVGGRYWADKKPKKYIILLLSLLLAFLIIYLSEAGTAYDYRVYAGIVGLILSSLLWIAYKKFKASPRFSTIAIASFLIMELIPLGSNAYKYQIVFGMYLAIPVITVYLYSLDKINFLYFNISKESIQALRSIISLTIIVFSLIVSIYYRGNGNEIRWKMIYSMDHPRLRGIFMTKEFARTINELTAAMNKYQKNFTYSLIYEEISTVAYLSDLQPYIYETYPLWMGVDELKRSLELASSQKSLPLVVRAIRLTYCRGWPNCNEPVNPGYKKTRSILESFLKKNHYQIVWKNDDFEILVPSQKVNKL